MDTFVIFKFYTYYKIVKHVFMFYFALYRDETITDYYIIDLFIFSPLKNLLLLIHPNIKV